MFILNLIVPVSWIRDKCVLHYTRHQQAGHIIKLSCGCQCTITWFLYHHSFVLLFLLMLNNVSRIWFYYNGKWRRVIQFFSTRNHHLLPYQNKIGNVSFLFPLYLISMCNTKQRNICLFNIIHYLIILKMLISNSKWWHFVTRYNGNDNFVPYDRKEYETKL